MENELCKRAYVETIRGWRSGTRLARPAYQITVGKIARWPEAPLMLVECFDTKTNTWPHLDACHLSRGLQCTLRASLSVQDDMTVADVVIMPALFFVFAMPFGMGSARCLASRPLRLAAQET